jgi:hypothetical protein
MVVHGIGRIAAVAAALALLGIGGCARSPLPRPAATLRAAVRPLPVRYVDQGNPDPLTSDQVKGIRDAASDAVESNGPLWFVLVLSNHNGEFSTIAYFVPDQSSSRVRRVKCMGISSLSLRFHKIPADRADYPVEIQIAPPGEATGALPTVPALADAPFPEPVGRDGRPLMASDDELARLIDFARSYLDKPERCHIHRIEATNEGFRVYTGWQTGIRGGGGTYLDVSRKDGAFYCPKDLHQDGQLGGVIGIWRS